MNRGLVQILDVAVNGREGEGYVEVAGGRCSRLQDPRRKKRRRKWASNMDGGGQQCDENVIRGLGASWTRLAFGAHSVADFILFPVHLFG